MRLLKNVALAAVMSALAGCAASGPQGYRSAQQTLPLPEGAAMLTMS